MNDNKLKNVLELNGTGQDAIVDMIVRLIAEGVHVHISPIYKTPDLENGNDVGFEVTTRADQFKILGTGRSFILLEALSDAWTSTPDAKKS